MDFTFMVPSPIIPTKETTKKQCERYYNNARDFEDSYSLLVYAYFVSDVAETIQL